MNLLRRPTIVCQQWTELITDYLEGALPRGLVKAINRHLSACPHCTEYLAQMQRTIEITGSLPIDEHVPGEMIDALQRAFEDFHHGLAPEP
jgi:anti-sigma factor RsiW